MKLKDYFPDMTRGSLPLNDDQWISLENEEGYLHLPKNGLSERELLLLELIQKQTQEKRVGDISSPWYPYLIEQKGKQPHYFAQCQFIYLNHHLPLSEDLVDLFHSLIPGVEVILPVSQTRTVLLLRQETDADTLRVLADTLPTIESDFGLALMIFVGNSWNKLSGTALRDYFEEENALFSHYLNQKAAGNLVTFAKLMLWSLLSSVGFPHLEQHFSQVLSNHKEMSEVVLAMWQSQGNLVQTAQALFIHRNSLQYKLDKFAQQSGLHLKNLDDLAFAYLFLLKH
ncbi:helix-turn-helix domain-containing protein [Streptococcus ictaluri]|uniref:Leucine-rich protein n=1 Tax=Streptococcus ictaluri 707-05 TaxID=764299 RepID=G5JZQ2_9STRE|nr:helix-turn-helix domain-containing protein [Streptococcus ictaluri]EHI70726.1 leucine-rich protein [Streptococcus ictaluri 707-05]